MNVAFATLFLGLILGPQEVRLSVGGGVTAVELRLDGALVARMAASPWSAVVDFGPEILPRDLEAVAFDSEAHEAGRARIRVNIPRPKAQASFVLEPRDRTGHQMARLAWESTVAARPRTIRITLDEKVLDVEDPSRFEIPSGEPGRTRILRADLRFGNDISAVAEAFLGSHGRDYTSAELSAVAVVLKGNGELPPPAELSNWFVADGKPLRVVAVERGPADVVFIIDPGTEDRLERIHAIATRTRSSAPPLSSRVFRLSRDSFFYFALPLPTPVQGTSYVGIPLAGPFSRSEGGIIELYLDVRKQAPLRNAAHLARIAPLTGTAAVRNGRRRAAVWILDADREKDDPNLRRGRSYLAALNVPLFVWRVGPGGDSASGAAGESRISVPFHLDLAISALEEALDRQRIVWVEGDPLPQKIVLTPRVTGIVLAR